MVKYVKLRINTITKTTDIATYDDIYWAEIEMPSARIIKVRLNKRDYELIEKGDYK